MRRLGDELRAIAQVAPEALIAPSRLEALFSKTAEWPSESIAAIGLEVRLGAGPDADVDFACMITRPGAAAQTFTAERFPDWAPLVRFFHDWDGLHQRISDVWLELDAAQRAPLPAVFLQTRQYPRVPDADLGPVADALERLSGRQVAAETLALMRKVQPNLCYVGVMLSRDQPGWRITLDETRETLGDDLHKLGWPGDMSALKEWLATWGPLHTGGYALDVDLAPGAQAKVGLEIIKPLGAPLLEALVARGYLSQVERAALEGWNTPPAPYMRARRYVNHLKFVFAPPAPLQVKAYLQHNLQP